MFREPIHGEELSTNAPQRCKNRPKFKLEGEEGENPNGCFSCYRQHWRLCTKELIGVTPTQAPGTSSPGQVGQHGDSQVKVEAEPTPADPAAKQRAIDAELNRDIRRAIDVEVSRAIQGAPSDAKE